MPAQAAATARIADRISSPETFGPTDSTDGKVMDGSTVFSASSTCPICSGVIDWVASCAPMRTMATC